MNIKYLLIKPSVLHTDLLAEYTNLTTVLSSKGIEVVEFSLSEGIDSSAYLCSKHWITFHGNGAVAVYPMSTIDRQRERSDEVFDVLEKNNYIIDDVFDFTEGEEDGYFLEGAGSIVIDKKNSVAYASISSCCDEELFIEFCEELEYTPVVFSSEFQDQTEVKHTSKAISISDGFVLFCSEVIKDKKERKLVALQLKKSGRELIYITENQALNFGSEIIQVKNNKGQSFIIMSKSIDGILTDRQKKSIEKYGEFIIVDYGFTEAFGKHSIGNALNSIDI